MSENRADQQTGPFEELAVSTIGAAEPDLPAIATRVREEHAKANASVARAIEHAIAAGKLLIEAKAAIRHGKWAGWVRDHCEVSHRTATNYMRLAQAKLGEEISSGDANLSVRGALKLLAPAKPPRTRTKAKPTMEADVGMPVEEEQTPLPIPTHAATDKCAPALSPTPLDKPKRSKAEAMRDAVDRLSEIFGALKLADCVIGTLPLEDRVTLAQRILKQAAENQLTVH